MGNSASKKKAQKRDEAILELKRQRDSLKKYSKMHIESAARKIEVAKQCLERNEKDRALLALRSKKMHEQQLAKTTALIQNLEEMVNSIEYAALEVEVLKGLDSGNSALKSIMKEMSIDKVDLIMQESAEAQEYVAELKTILAESLNQQDEDSVAQELDEILRSQAAPLTVTQKEGSSDTSKITSESAVDSKIQQLPDVPQTELPVLQSEHNKNETTSTKKIQSDPPVLQEQDLVPA